MTPSIDVIPIVNTLLLAVLVIVMAAVVYRRHVASNSLYRQNLAILTLLRTESAKRGSDSQQLLDMVKVLIAELRQRPCVTTSEVAYRTDARPPSSSSKKLG